MNTDSYFTIGKSHMVCEDYALSGENYVIISDGCSSSPDTDFGARLLAKVCEQELLQQGIEFSEDAVIYKADAMASHIGLPKNCLDATLIVAQDDEDQVRVKIFGDGAVIAVKKDGTLTYSIAQYKNNAPAYLSYLLDRERTELYLEKTDNGLYTETHFDGSRERNFKFHGKLNPQIYYFEKDAFDLVIVVSDGIESFSKPVINDTTKLFVDIPITEIVSQIVNIKGFKGKFIERRCRKFLNKFCAVNNWQHNDDLSVAAIHWGS